jgi:hypothetical protein
MVRRASSVPSGSLRPAHRRKRKRAALEGLVASETARYSANLADAKALCGAEDAELAALTLACGAILSCDEARNVR